MVVKPSTMEGGGKERKRTSWTMQPSKEGKKPLLTSAWNSLLPGKMGIYVGMRKMPEQHAPSAPQARVWRESAGPVMPKSPLVDMKLS
jgi:hypothetical protein